MIFQTKRLFIRKLKSTDKELFYELMGNPNVMEPIPRNTLTKEQSDKRLEELITLEKFENNKIWCLTIKDNPDLIGICGFVQSNEGHFEIAYSILEKCWRNGFGTEIAKGLIAYSFEKLNLDKVIAEVNIENLYSIKILDGLMTPMHDTINTKDNCTDRYYELIKDNWTKNK